ncbi:MAG: hypothetical protein ABIH34_03430 [Nanoarchaeota archaeon]
MKYLFLIPILFLIACSPSQEFIQDEIDKANFCETKDDCALAGSKCPFDCYIYVNSAHVDRIKGFVDSYRPLRRCFFSCVACEPICYEGKCECIPPNE